MKFCFLMLLSVFQFNLESKIFDCFTFFNELELLKIRFEELYDVVDHFVLVEATQTFSGNPKPLYFSENAVLFDKYKDKIIVIIVDDLPCPTTDVDRGKWWERQELQLNAALRGLTQCDNDDIIIISDLDEIPNRQSVFEIIKFFEGKKFCDFQRSYLDIEKYQNHLVCELRLRLFPFHLNQESKLGWFGFVKAVPYWLVKKRSLWNIKLLHMYDRNLHKIHNAGWHFHCMGGKDQLQKKLEALYHYDNLSFLKPSTMKLISPDLVPSNEKTFDREWPEPLEISRSPDLFIAWTEAVIGWEVVEIDSSYPQFVLNNIEYYKSLGWIK